MNLLSTGSIQKTFCAQVTSVIWHYVAYFILTTKSDTMYNLRSKILLRWQTCSQLKSKTHNALLRNVIAAVYDTEFFYTITCHVISVSFQASSAIESYCDMFGHKSVTDTLTHIHTKHPYICLTDFVPHSFLAFVCCVSLWCVCVLCTGRTLHF